MSSCNGGPFFSICVASYNAARYIGECLESIACQSFKDYEVVLVDDGSTDGTADVVDSVAYMFEPGVLRSFRSPDNRGTYETRLDLIRRSLGDYILFLDSDDMYASPDALQKMHKAISSGRLDILVFNATRSMEVPRPLESLGCLVVGDDGLLDLQAVRRCALNTYKMNSLCYKAVRRDLLGWSVEAGRRVDMCEDRLLSVSAILTADRVGLLDEPLYFYRKNEESVTRKRFYVRFFFDQMFVDSTLCARARSAGLDVSGLYRMDQKLMCSDLRLCATAPKSDRSLEVFDELLGSMRAEPFAREALGVRPFRRLRPDEALLVGGIRRGWPSRVLYVLARGFAAAKRLVAD